MGCTRERRGVPGEGGRRKEETPLSLPRPSPMGDPSSDLQQSQFMISHQMSQPPDAIALPGDSVPRLRGPGAMQSPAPPGEHSPC